jgi:hypothetical protein
MLIIIIIIIINITLPATSMDEACFLSSSFQAHIGILGCFLMSGSAQVLQHSGGRSP